MTFGDVGTQCPLGGGSVVDLFDIFTTGGYAPSNDNCFVEYLSEGSWVEDAVPTQNGSFFSQCVKQFCSD